MEQEAAERQGSVRYIGLAKAHAASPGQRLELDQDVLQDLREACKCARIVGRLDCR